MTIDKVLVLIFSGLGIGFIYWFFLLKKTKEIQVSESVDIIVNGGYSPEVVVIPYGQTTKLNFIRKDPSGCLEEIMISDFRIRQTLPLNKKTTIEITPNKRGEFGYSCGMNMFHGKIIVR